MYFFAIEAISEDIVAEKRSVLLPSGTSSSISFMLSRKPHIEHLIRFVENNGGDFRKMGCSSSNKVDQSARCGHDNMHSFLQSPYLIIYTCSTIYSKNFKFAHVLGEIRQIAGDLNAKFPCGAKDKRLCRPDRCVCHLYKRKPECSSFTCAGFVPERLCPDYFPSSSGSLFPVQAWDSQSQVLQSR